MGLTLLWHDQYRSVQSVYKEDSSEQSMFQSTKTISASWMTAKLFVAESVSINQETKKEIDIFGSWDQAGLPHVLHNAVKSNTWPERHKNKKIFSVSEVLMFYHVKKIRTTYSWSHQGIILPISLSRCILSKDELSGTKEAMLNKNRQPCLLKIITLHYSLWRCLNECICKVGTSQFLQNIHWQNIFWVFHMCTWKQSQNEVVMVTFRV